MNSQKSRMYTVTGQKLEPYIGRIYVLKNNFYSKNVTLNLISGGNKRSYKTNLRL